MTVSLEQARAAKEKLARDLASTPGLVGIGITKIGEDYAVQANFNAPPAAPIPDSVAGVPVRVQVVGTIRKRPGG